MTKLSKSDTAKCLGVSRSTLYDYIKQGRIPVDPDGKIDTTELLKRGFGFPVVSEKFCTLRDYTLPYKHL